MNIKFIICDLFLYINICIHFKICICKFASFFSRMTEGPSLPGSGLKEPKFRINPCSSAKLYLNLMLIFSIVASAFPFPTAELKTGGAIYRSFPFDLKGFSGSV